MTIRKKENEVTDIHAGWLGDYPVVTEIRKAQPQRIPPAAIWTRKDQRLVDAVVRCYPPDDAPLDLIAASKLEKGRIDTVGAELTRLLQASTADMPANLRRRISVWLGNHQPRLAVS